jgi:predicted aldo/keto reductase-like oxidoreductase
LQHRKLGRTGLDVGAIGLGTEYLYGQSQETVVSVVHEATERGVNYIDLLLPFPEYRDNFGAALRGRRECVILAGHLGATAKNGQYCKMRSPRKSEPFFLDLLSRLGTDYVDILMLHNFNTLNDYERAVKPRGLMDLAHRFQQEGKARFIGISAHSVEVATKATESGMFDLLMFPINLAGNAIPGKKDLLKACVTHNVGLVAMKPFAGGKLLSKERTVRVARYQMGGEALKLKKSVPIAAAQCLSYALVQVGVSTVIPGCANLEELAAALAYWEATEEERDFSAIVADFQQYAAGECVYCNHCLPCPSVIDIGQTIRLLDMAQQHLTAELQAAYKALPAKASDCVQCGACTERCPFGVDVTLKMEQAVELFEQRGSQTRRWP